MEKCILNKQLMVSDFMVKNTRWPLTHNLEEVFSNIQEFIHQKYEHNYRDFIDTSLFPDHCHSLTLEFGDLVIDDQLCAMLTRLMPALTNVRFSSYEKIYIAAFIDKVLRHREWGEADSVRKEIPAFKEIPSIDNEDILSVLARLGAQMNKTDIPPYSQKELGELITMIRSLCPQPVRSPYKHLAIQSGSIDLMKTVISAELFYHKEYEYVPGKEKMNALGYIIYLYMDQGSDGFVMEDHFRHLLGDRENVQMKINHPVNQYHSALVYAMIGCDSGSVAKRESAVRFLLKYSQKMLSVPTKDIEMKEYLCLNKDVADELNRCLQGKALGYQQILVLRKFNILDKITYKNCSGIGRLLYLFYKAIDYFYNKATFFMRSDPDYNKHTSGRSSANMSPPVSPVRPTPGCEQEPLTSRKP